MDFNDGKKPRSCPCYLTNHKYGDFSKIMGSEDVGIEIYQHRPQAHDPAKDELLPRKTMDGNAFVVHNLGRMPIFPDDFMPTLDIRKIKCQRCKKIIRQAYNLLCKVPRIDKVVTGICDHCISKTQITCEECERVIQKFLKTKDQQEPKQRTKMKYWTSNIKEAFKELVNSTSTLKFRKYPISEPDILQAPLRAQKVRSTKSVPRSTYTREFPDYVKLYDRDEKEADERHVNYPRDLRHVNTEIFDQEVRSTKSVPTSTYTQEFLDAVKFYSRHEKEEDLGFGMGAQDLRHINTEIFDQKLRLTKSVPLSTLARGFHERVRREKEDDERFGRYPRDLRHVNTEIFDDTNEIEDKYNLQDIELYKIYKNKHDFVKQFKDKNKLNVQKGQKVPEKYFRKLEKEIFGDDRDDVHKWRIKRNLFYDDDDDYGPKDKVTKESRKPFLPKPDFYKVTSLADDDLYTILKRSSENKRALYIEDKNDFVHEKYNVPHMSMLGTKYSPNERRKFLQYLGMDMSDEDELHDINEKRKKQALKYNDVYDIYQKNKSRDKSAPRDILDKKQMYDLNEILNDYDSENWKEQSRAVSKLRQHVDLEHYDINNKKQQKQHHLRRSVSDTLLKMTAYSLPQERKITHPKIEVKPFTSYTELSKVFSSQPKQVNRTLRDSIAPDGDKFMSNQEKFYKAILQLIEASSLYDHVKKPERAKLGRKPKAKASILKKKRPKLEQSSIDCLRREFGRIFLLEDYGKDFQYFFPRHLSNEQLHPVNSAELIAKTMEKERQRVEAQTKKREIKEQEELQKRMLLEEKERLKDEQRIAKDIKMYSEAVKQKKKIHDTIHKKKDGAEHKKKDGVEQKKKDGLDDTIKTISKEKKDAEKEQQISEEDYDENDKQKHVQEQLGGKVKQKHGKHEKKERKIRKQSSSSEINITEYMKKDRKKGHARKKHANYKKAITLKLADTIYQTTQINKKSRGKSHGKSRGKSRGVRQRAKDNLDTDLKRESEIDEIRRKQKYDHLLEENLPQEIKSSKTEEEIGTEDQTHKRTSKEKYEDDNYNESLSKMSPQTEDVKNDQIPSKRSAETQKDNKIFAEKSSQALEDDEVERLLLKKLATTRKGDMKKNLLTKKLTRSQEDDEENKLLTQIPPQPKIYKKKDQSPKRKFVQVQRGDQDEQLLNQQDVNFDASETKKDQETSKNTTNILKTDSHRTEERSSELKRINSRRTSSASQELPVKGSKQVNRKDMLIEDMFKKMDMQKKRIIKQDNTKTKNRKKAETSTFKSKYEPKKGKPFCSVFTQIDCDFCRATDNSDSNENLVQTKRVKSADEIIIIDEIYKQKNVHLIEKKDAVKPVFTKISEPVLDEEKEEIVPKVHQKPHQGLGPQFAVRYALSNRKFIDKGWTILPTEKVVRKVNVFRMRPAQQQFDWFSLNKNRGSLYYDTGEKLAEVDKNGRGRWYYKNGRIALEYYDCEEANADKRVVVYGSGEPDRQGCSRPATILATFDYLGNAVVFDHTGKIRLKYNQSEGVMLDRSLGPVTNWKWHSLNDPPLLRRVMVESQLPFKDPDILRLSDEPPPRPEPEDPEMIALELKREQSRKDGNYTPYQIRMKALKINDWFSLRVMDQATVHLLFRAGKTNMKLNLGMVLDHNEIVDTDVTELGEVLVSAEVQPARTDSLAEIQRSVERARKFEQARVTREQWTRPTMPQQSADRLIAAATRPRHHDALYPVICKNNMDFSCPCKHKKPSSSDIYHSTCIS